MIDRESSLSDIEVNRASAEVASNIGSHATRSSTETIYVEFPSHIKNPNQVLMPGQGIKLLHEEIELPL